MRNDVWASRTFTTTMPKTIDPRIVEARKTNSSRRRRGRGASAAGRGGGRDLA
jgi:hypothetical protein